YRIAIAFCIEKLPHNALYCGTSVRFRKRTVMVCYPIRVVNSRELPSLLKLSNVFFCEQNSLFPRVDQAISLGFGDRFEELAENRSRLKAQAAHQFVSPNQARRHDFCTLANIAGKEQTGDREVTAPGFREWLWS